MNNVDDLLHTRLDAIEIAISRLAISINETGGPHAVELESSIDYFRELFDKPDISPRKRETYLRTIRLLDPLGNDLIDPF